MDLLLDGIFHNLFTSIDPLGMILRTLMALLADSLAQVATGMYTSLFDLTTIDFQQAAVANIWHITTGLSASLATILLVIAAFRSMFAQSNRYLLAALPGVVLALVGPQAMTLLRVGHRRMPASFSHRSRHTRRKGRRGHLPRTLRPGRVEGSHAVGGDVARGR